MAVLVAFAVAVIALLVWVGRRPLVVSRSARLLSALFAAVAAVAAVASVLRGGWIASLILVGLSAALARTSRAGRGQAAPPPASGPEQAEARAILGVGPDAGREEILAAYRRLMQFAHPDHGGSTGLAAQLNLARDRLLRP
jgi:hypothetical protein